MKYLYRREELSFRIYLQIILSKVGKVRKCLKHRKIILYKQTF